jgi:hypothetical protein
LPFIIIIIFHPSSLSTYVSTIGKDICKWSQANLIVLIRNLEKLFPPYLAIY